MKQKKQTVIIVTAYDEDNYYQKKHEDVVGIYTSVRNAIKGAKADGMTNRQEEKLRNLNVPGSLYLLLKYNQEGSFQVDYEEETDKRRKPCESSYMFKTYNLD